MKTTKHHAIFEVHDDGGKKSIGVITPKKAIRIDSKDELQAQLEHYAKAGGPVFLRNMLPDDAKARYRHVRYVRPALRYYCRKFSIKIPKWLDDDSHFSTLSKGEMVNLFGKPIKFPVREFARLKMLMGGKPADVNA